MHNPILSNNTDKAASLHNERRCAHRYKAQLQVDLILADGAVLPVESCDISNHGLQFICDSWIADEMDPRGIQSHSLDHIQLKISTALPVEDENRLYALCRVVAARRLSQDQYLVSLEFRDFEKDSDQVLVRYMDELMKSATRLGKLG